MKEQEKEYLLIILKIPGGQKWTYGGHSKNQEDKSGASIQKTFLSRHGEQKL